MTSYTDDTTETPSEVPAPEPAQQQPPVTPGAPPGAQPPAPAPPEEQRQDWYRAVRSVRTRILASYVVLLAIAALLAMFGVRQLLFSQLEERVQSSFAQEIAEFEAARLRCGPRDPGDASRPPRG